MAIELGLKGTACCIVDEKNTAKSLRSGGLEVLATPIMVALMEEAALKSVRPYLSATPVGLKAWAESELVEIDRRKLVFEVKAYDEAGLIGEGRHERFIVDIEKFTSKCFAKLNK